MQGYSIIMSKNMNNVECTFAKCFAIPFPLNTGGTSVWCKSAVSDFTQEYCKTALWTLSSKGRKQDDSIVELKHN